MKISLANLEQATAQQVFDQVANHLLTQGQRCEIVDPVNHGRSCTYRSADGKLACAAGCLLSDKDMSEVHGEGMNTGAGWPTIVDALNATTNHMQLITKLQIVHDDSDPLDWREQLFDLAEEQNLNTEVLHAYSS